MPCTPQEGDDALQDVMRDIHAACAKDGTRDGKTNYAKGANNAGFRKMADATVAQGLG